MALVMMPAIPNALLAEIFLGMGALTMIAIVVALALNIFTLARWTYRVWKRLDRQDERRIAKGVIVASILAASIFILVGFDCDIFGGWIPSWLCYAV